MDDTFQEKIKSIKALVKQANYNEAFSRLCAIAQPSDDFSLHHRYVKLFNSIPKDQLELKPIDIAIVATSTVDHFADVFRFYMAKDGFNAKIYLADYNTLDQTILDPASGLYQFDPAVVWLFSNYRDVRANIPHGCSPKTSEEGIQGAVDRFRTLWNAVQKHSSAYIIQNNADLPLERTFGNYEGSVHWSRINFLRQFNVSLARAVISGVTVFDLDYLSSFWGKYRWFDERFWYHSQHAFSLDAIGQVSFSGARLIKAITGQAKKCLVLDLDNTLWGGIIGDDGLEGIRLGSGAEGEAFADFQKFVHSLKERGIVLAVCSKNEEDAAKLPFLHHPDMRLSLDDIAVFLANWDNKADNIRKAAEILELGLDSFVFVDDNPVERDLVRQILPMVSVPELPEDPALYVRALQEQGYFETITFSHEDKARGEMYRSNVQRKVLSYKFTDLSDFLRDLEMQAVVGEFDGMNLPRIGQLINKSNQFHLTTTRYTEAQLLTRLRDKNTVCRYFKLKDRLGDNGLISVIVLQKQDDGDLLVDTWVMSCRVLTRGMEEFVYNEMVAIAQALHCQRILGKYIPTKKNQLVAHLYEKLGYGLVKESEGTTHWELNIVDDQPLKETFIRRVDSY
jgi:FkbH-like protein